MVLIFVLSLSALVVAGANSIIRDPAGDAAAACATLNLTMQLSLMRGFGQIDGYSRNSGCGDVCGRHTFRWDNVSLKTSYMLLPMPFIFTSFSHILLILIAILSFFYRDLKVLEMEQNLVLQLSFLLLYQVLQRLIQT
jgi:hypothetical protein